MTVLARGWDFFSYYMTLVMTPMMMISGVFFPAEQLPAPLLAVAQGAAALPRGGAGAAADAGELPAATCCCTSRCSLGYAAVGYVLAIRFARKRFSA